MDTRYRLMKATIFIFFILLYLLSYGWYIWDIYSIPMCDNIIKIWNYTNIGGLTFAMLMLYLTGIDTFILQQFFIIAFIILLVTFTIIILVNLLIVSNPYYILGIFYGANFIFAVMVLISGIKHGIFKE